MACHCEIRTPLISQEFTLQAEPCEISGRRPSVRTAPRHGRACQLRHRVERQGAGGRRVLLSPPAPVATGCNTTHVDAPRCRAARREWLSPIAPLTKHRTGTIGQMDYFNPPPGWPSAPPGWRPPQGWQPDPRWPDAPADWHFWIDESRSPVAGPEGLYGAESSPSWRDARERIGGALRSLDTNTAEVRRAAANTAAEATRTARNTAANLRQRYESRESDDQAPAAQETTQPVPQSWAQNLTQRIPRSWPRQSSSGATLATASTPSTADRSSLLKRGGLAGAGLILFSALIAQCNGGSGATSNPSVSASASSTSAPQSSTAPSRTTQTTSTAAAPSSTPPTRTSTTSHVPDRSGSSHTRTTSTAPRAATPPSTTSTRDERPATSAPIAPVVPQETYAPETPDAEPTGSAFYSSCAEVKAAGAAPILAGQPGYSRKLDRDGDGIACEK